MRLLNVGCGQRFHPAWTNIDLVSTHPNVQAHDLRQGLPYADNEFDAVYQSHVLEHLTPDAGLAMLRECQRVLRPGGILRVVVPDLEMITRLYLQELEAAVDQQPGAEARYDWMVCELLDQLVRTRSGGRTAELIRDPDFGAQDLMAARWGDEAEGLAGYAAASPQARSQKSKTRWLTSGYWSRKLNKTKTRWTDWCVRTFLLPGDSQAAWQEAIFRQSGEVHRWMYDRYSLSRALSEVGLEDVRVCRADESQIAGFTSFELDTCGDRTRKPDSLFVEGIKPAAAARRAA